MKPVVIALLALAVSAPGAAYAQSADSDSLRPSSAKPAPASGTLADGEVRKVDKDAKKITIKHGPLQGINMPGMTMSFLVKDKAMLANLQPLQKVNFELTYDGTNYMITKIQ